MDYERQLALEKQRFDDHVHDLHYHYASNPTELEQLEKRNQALEAQSVEEKTRYDAMVRDFIDQIDNVRKSIVDHDRKQAEELQRLDDQTRSITNLEDELKSYKLAVAEHEAATAKVTDLQSQVTSQEQTIRQLQDAISENDQILLQQELIGSSLASGTVLSLSKEVEDLKRLVKKRDEELADLNSSLEAVKTDQANLIVDLAARTTEMQSLTDRLKDREAALSAIESQFEEIRHAKRGEWEALEEELEMCKAQVQDLKCVIQDSEQEITSLNTAAADRAEELRRYREQLSAYTLMLPAQDNTIQDKSKLPKTPEEAPQSLLQNLPLPAEETDALVNVSKSDSVDLSQLVTSQAQQIAGYQKKLLDLAMEISTIEVKLQESVTQTAQANSSMCSLEAEVSHLKSLLDEATGKLSALSGIHNTAQEEIKQYKLAIESWREHSAEKEESGKHSQTEIAILLDQLQKEIENSKLFKASVCQKVLTIRKMYDEEADQKEMRIESLENLLKKATADESVQKRTVSYCLNMYLLIVNYIMFETDGRAASGGSRCTFSWPFIRYERFCFQYFVSFIRFGYAYSRI